MIGVGCGCKSHLVTGITVVDRVCITGAVARLTLQVNMRAIDGKARLIMIELRRLPRCCGVALLAIVAEIRRLMIRVVSRRKSGAVTGETIRRRIGVPAAVTVLAGQCRMCAG